MPLYVWLMASTGTTTFGGRAEGEGAAKYVNAADAAHMAYLVRLAAGTDAFN